MFDWLKVLWISLFLKKSIPSEIKPKRYPEQKPNTDLPQFRDRYFERTSDPKFAEIDEKVRQVVANLKARGRF